MLGGRQLRTLGEEALAGSGRCSCLLVEPVNVRGLHIYYEIGRFSEGGESGVGSNE